VLFTSDSWRRDLRADVAPRFAGKRKKLGFCFAFLTGLLAVGQRRLLRRSGEGSASVIVPLTSLSPLVTVLVGVLVLKEKMRWFQYIGLALALTAIYLLSL